MVLVVSALATLAQVFALSAYAFPHADDYCRSVRVREAGTASLVQSAWRVMVDAYFRENARFSSMFVAALVIGSLDAYVSYPWPILAFALVHWLGLTGFTITVLRMRAVPGAIAGLVLTAILFSAMPSLNESVYWFTSAVEYTLAVSGLLLLAIVHSTRGSSLAWQACRSVLAFVVAGQHEFNAVAIMLIAGASAWIASRRDRLQFRGWCMTLLAGAAVFGLMLVAPGRGAAAVPQPLGVEGLLSASWWTGTSAIRWVSASSVVFGAITWAGWVGRDTVPEWLDDRRVRWLVPICAGVLAVMAIGAAPLLSGFGQRGRTLNWGFSIYVIGLMVWIAACRSQVLREVKPFGLLVPAVMLALSGALVVTPNIELVRRGLRQPVSSWRATMIGRVALPRGEDVILPIVAVPTPMLSASGVGERSDEWLNLCYAEYFGFRSVIAEKGARQLQ